MQVNKQYVCSIHLLLLFFRGFPLNKMACHKKAMLLKIGKKYPNLTIFLFASLDFRPL